MPQKPERMHEFFDQRAEGYEDHMRRSLESFDRFYAFVAEQVEPTERKIEVLDLGCGTGLELKGVLARAPAALVTGVDVSKRMLKRLRCTFKGSSDQLRLVHGSYLSVPFAPEAHDYVLAVQTLHHLTAQEKENLYRRIWTTLRSGGKYIEGDYVVSPEVEKQLLDEYSRQKGDVGEDGLHHIDIPFSVATQRCLLLRGGFSSVEVVFDDGQCAVLVARKD